VLVRRQVRFAFIINFFVLFSAGTSEAIGQVAKSFEQLEVLVTPEDKVSITDLSGRTLRGTIVSLSSSSLRLNIQGAAPRDLAPDEVLEIKSRRPDFLGNGAMIGRHRRHEFWGPGRRGALFRWRIFPMIGVAAVSFALYTAMGTGVGVGIDALVEREQTVYRAPPKSSARIRVHPIVVNRSRGVRVSFSF
jgi:hypothetical protein